MFKTKSVGRIFFVLVTLAFSMTGYNFYYIYPSFTKLLVKNTENEAVRLGTHFAKMYFPDNKPVSKHSIAKIQQHAIDQITDFNLMKLKIFSPSGEIIFSTSKNDIGKINEHDYFHNLVAKGRPFTKVVKKDTQSLEGQNVTADVVETYVPVMSGDKFMGAFEMYYDITGRTQDLASVMNKSMLFPVLMLLFGIAITIIMMLKLDKGITRRKEAEEELKIYADKLNKSNVELQDFAHIASHDLQEPLRKVIAFGDRLASRYTDVLDDRARDYLGRMQNAAQRMQSLITSLLDFSRVTTKAQPFETVDLTKLINEVISDLEVRLQETGGEIEIGELSEIDADPLQMRQLMQNLVGNALKYTKKDTPPLVKVYGEIVSGSAIGDNGEAAYAKADSEHFRLTVEDNGIGFDEKYANRIFGVFQRLHGKQEYEGTGIGLSICRKITERHGGGIIAKGVPGEGAKFIATLPVKQINDGGNNGS